jgi:predicted DNA-binding transcriptional regulator AlpA
LMRSEADSGAPPPRDNPAAAHDTEDETPMDAQTLPAAPEAGKPETFITRREHRRRCGDISKATELRLINGDPDHPKPVRIGRGLFVYVESESDRYREILIARRNANGGS